MKSISIHLVIHQAMDNNKRDFLEYAAYLLFTFLIIIAFIFFVYKHKG